MNVLNPTAIAPKNGYAFIYVSNESDAQTVYFDNLAVVHTRSKLLEEATYYPFGLKIQTLSAQAFQKPTAPDKFQGEYSDYEEETGWNDFELRSYDPQIGRWLQVDPYDEFASTYTGMGNDPVNNVDPDGGGIDGPEQNVTVIGDLFKKATNASAFWDAVGKITLQTVAFFGNNTTIYNYINSSGKTMWAADYYSNNVRYQGESWHLQGSADIAYAPTRPDIDYSNYLSNSIGADRFNYGSSWLGNAFKFAGNVGVSIWNGGVGLVDAVRHPVNTMNELTYAGDKAMHYTWQVEHVNNPGAMVGGDIKTLLTDPRTYENIVATIATGKISTKLSLTASIAEDAGVVTNGPGLRRRTSYIPSTPNQQALRDLVKEVTLYGRKPLSITDAHTVIGWGAEVGYPGFRASASDMAPLNNHWIGGPHINFPGVGSGHVPIIY